MKKSVLIVLILFFSTLVYAECVDKPIEGFGATQGAEECGTYETYVVNTLEDDDVYPFTPGTLRDALRNANCRYITFEVSGTIELESQITVSSVQYITIDGSTASGGITITTVPGFSSTNGIYIHSGDDIVFKNIRFRDYTTSSGSSVAAFLSIPSGAHNIVVDHCSFTGSNKRNLYLGHTEDVTVQYSLFGGNTENVLLRESDNISIHHNIFVSSYKYNPSFQGTQANALILLDFVNNLVYDWGISHDSGTHLYLSSANVVNNYYISTGVSSDHASVRFMYGDQYGGGLYLDGNILPEYHIANGTVQVPYPAPEVTIYPTEIAGSIVLGEAGACPRDAIDQALVSPIDIEVGGVYCSDGTLGGICSEMRPYYCHNGELIERCSLCGCPGNRNCKPDGTCIPSKLKKTAIQKPLFSSEKENILGLIISFFRKVF